MEQYLQWIEIIISINNHARGYTSNANSFYQIQRSLVKIRAEIEIEGNWASIPELEDLANETIAALELSKSQNLKIYNPDAFDEDLKEMKLTLIELNKKISTLTLRDICFYNLFSILDTFNSRYFSSASERARNKALGITFKNKFYAQEITTDRLLELIRELLSSSNRPQDAKLNEAILEVETQILLA